MQVVNFNQKDIRCQEYKGETWYSLIDVIAAITDSANRETILRLIQSIPSSSVESFKLFLANAGHTMMKETENPELLMERLRASLRKKGYDESWINARLRNITAREELTEQWKERGMKDRE